MTYCDNCEASLSETDYDCGRCTQCGHQITTEETRTMSNEETYKQLLEEYLRRRNDSEFDLLWDKFDEKVKEALAS